MRYKKKHLLFIVTAGWCVWYLGLFQTGQNVNEIFAVKRIQMEDKPDIFRYKAVSDTASKSVVSIKASLTDQATNSPLNTSDPLWLATFLPHIRNVTYVQPRIKWSQGRNNVSIIIGIPTVKRPSEDSYILDTIQSFFDAMSDKERSDVIIVVSITEPWNLEFESGMLTKIKERFPAQLEEGSLEVICPYPGFYPDLNKLKLSLGDAKSRVKWRSKQNLDYGFLMMHCMGKAAYYLQMEDDISTVKGFVTSIKKTVAKEKKQWMSLSFSQLGYIGRLYKIHSVHGIMEYLIKHFDQKPCDWLQYDYLRQVLCPPSQSRKKCDPVISKYTWLIKPTLFQHKGFRSSFQGNINKLQDKYFAQGGKVALYSNPKVTSLLTSLQIHLSHTLKAAYNTKGFFWGKNPRKGDTIEFLYEPPIPLSRIAMISGQNKHPNDIIANATVEIMPATKPAANSSLHSLETVPLHVPGQEDVSSPNLEKQRQSAIPMLTSNPNPQFYVVGNFTNGKAEVKLAADITKIKLSIIRIRFGAKLDHWVILEQILVL